MEKIIAINLKLSDDTENKFMNSVVQADDSDEIKLNLESNLNFVQDKDNEKPVSDFKDIEMENLPDYLTIPKSYDKLNDFVTIFDKEIDDFISLKNINEIITSSYFNLKILNKKLKEYSNLTKLFLYFNKDKKKIKTRKK